MSNLTDKLKNAKDKVVEAGAKAKDNKAIEAVSKGIKDGADVVAKGAKAGADAVAKGAKAGAEKVKETVDGIAKKKEEKQASDKELIEFETNVDNSLDTIPASEKDIAEEKEEENVEENTDKVTSDVDVKALLNTVIDGAYIGQKVSINKNKLFVGDKEVTTLNCESYRNPDKRECVIHTKELFEAFKKKAKNPLDKMIKDCYITVIWRTGEKSVLCVDPVKRAMVIKLLS